jgi:hypothetical protein
MNNETLDYLISDEISSSKIQVIGLDMLAKNYTIFPETFIAFIAARGTEV